MTSRNALGFAAALLLVGIGAQAQPVEPPAMNNADAAPYIRSALPLDEPRHLCIDLPGHGDRVDLAAAFTVHTCKDGMWNLDQRFAWSEDGGALIMPQYDMCLAAAAPASGSPLTLAGCGTEETKWLWQNARLKPAEAPDLCVTIAEGRSELTPGGKRFPQRYRARDVALMPCDDAAIERQIWSVTQPLDLETTLLPPAGSLPIE